uniref:Uncharacterized protein n=1 Tax=Rhizophora mucronata TaxID=61149 RepID=A0A2P2PZ25_RHIMU
MRDIESLDGLKFVIFDFSNLVHAQMSNVKFCYIMSPILFLFLPIVIIK